MIVDGFPDLAGATILERRREARAHHDHIRRALMLEPRGHADMYGCILVPPVSPTADVGVLFTHNEGFSTMCGHGVIGVATVLVELGLVAVTEPETRVGLDTPAGFVEATVRVRQGRVLGVRFVNVPSFVLGLDRTVDVPGIGTVRYDLAYGGAFYAYVDAASVDVRLVPEHTARIVDLGRRIKRAVQDADPPTHPEDADLGFVYGVIFVGPAQTRDAHSRNVCVFADGEVDRSPTGTGVSGRLAIHHARGEIAEGASIRIESILGTGFTCRILSTSRVATHDAVVPEVGGRAFLTGRGELFVDPDDPLAEGFLLR